jgi:hypothetical protein
MDAVAIIATISAGIVTVVGILVNGYIARQQRLQAIELAEKAHTHERDLARGDRLYARRAPVYEEMIASVHAVMEHVEATEPVMSFGGGPELPPEPSLDDQRAMQAKLRTHGSGAVADALDEFTKHVRTFQMHVSESPQPAAGHRGRAHPDERRTSAGSRRPKNASRVLSVTSSPRSESLSPTHSVGRRGCVRMSV